VTRARVLAVVTGAAAVVAACAAREPRPLRPRLDPITRAERECDDGELDECIELGLMYEHGARFDPDAADEDEDHDDDRPRKRRRPPPRVPSPSACATKAKGSAAITSHA
jgi:hypothetical protein